MRFTQLVVFASLAIAASAEQRVLSDATTAPVDEAHINALVAQYDDPVTVMKLVDPASAAELEEPRLLQVFGEKPVWMTEGDKLRLYKARKGFVDLTESRDVHVIPKQAIRVWPELSHQDKVKYVNSRLSLQHLNTTITALTCFHTRYYKSEYGRESSHWVFNQVLDIIKNAPSSPALSVEKFTHSFPQSSVIARFEPPTGRNASAPIFIIGAHQDSLNYRFPLQRAPGADDDGSGTVTILEAFRELVATGFNPKYAVEFHWYAGEEGGLLGSRAIVRDYVKKNANVGAMLQFDMTAFVKKGTTPTFTLISTDVDNSLTNFTTNLAKEYVDEPVQQAKLFSGAGSDHMSWHWAGYPAAFATEGDPLAGNFDPYIHTPEDRADLESGEYSLEHALEASKVAVAFAIELGGWIEA